jgi:tRNA (cytidine/uridine-2'-O-)-methyltransferase
MNSLKKLHIVLYAPEIPGNAGSIGRTCLALNAELVLIRPYGFDLDEKAVRRAGLDYWKYVQLTEFDNWSDFFNKKMPQNNELFFIETKAQNSIYQAKFPEVVYLIFGSETKGLPNELIEKHQKQTYELPMFSQHIRSLNLSNAATAAAYIVYGSYINH